MIRWFTEVAPIPRKLAVAFASSVGLPVVATRQAENWQEF